MLLKAGVRSYYGPSILAEFAENGEIFPYTRRSVEKALFTSEEIGRIDLPEEWTSEYLPWTMENRTVRKKMNPCEPAICLRGSGMVRGPLIGGCIEVMEFMKETILWDRELFDGVAVWRGRRTVLRRCLAEDSRGGNVIGGVNDSSCTRNTCRPPDGKTMFVYRFVSDSILLRVKIMSGFTEQSKTTASNGAAPEETIMKRLLSVARGAHWNRMLMAYLKDITRNLA